VRAFSFFYGVNRNAVPVRSNPVAQNYSAIIRGTAGLSQFAVCITVFVLLVISHKRNVRPQGALLEGLGWPWNAAAFNDLYRHSQTQELHFQLLKIGKATLCR